MGQFVAAYGTEIALALAAAGTAVSVKSSVDAGKVASREAEQQARREGDAARAREIERRRKLLQSLANQSATAGAYGASPDLSVASADIKYAQDDTLTDLAGTRTEQNLLRARGRNAKRSGYYQAGGSLLDFGASAAYTFGGTKPKDPSAGRKLGGP